MEAVSNFFNSFDESANNEDTSKNNNNESNSSSTQHKEPLKPLSQMASQMATEKLIEKLLYMSLPSSSSNGLLSNDGSLSDQYSILKANKNKYLQIPSSENSVFSNDKYNLLKILSYENRLKYAASRPGLSIQIMSKNFINLNSRLSVPFCLVDIIEQYLTWENPVFTISLTMIISFLILNPNKILIAIPVLVYTQLITPNFYQKYKPNEYLRSQSNEFSVQEILPTTPIQPEKELSKEFILNITDLQNRMSLYIDTWDLIVAKINNYYLWKDDTKTIIQTMVLFLIILLTMITPLNLKFLLFIGFITLILVQHPLLKSRLLSTIHSEETRIKLLTSTNTLTSKITSNIINSQEAKIGRVKTCTALLKQQKVGMAWETIVSLDDYTPPVNYVYVENSSWRLILNRYTNDNSDIDKDETDDLYYDTWRYYGPGKNMRERKYIRYITREVLVNDEIKNNDKTKIDEEIAASDYDGFIVL